MSERIATKKDDAYMIKRRAEGATYLTIKKELKAAPELPSLSLTTVRLYLVPEIREREVTRMKKYHSTEEGALARLWASMKHSRYKVEMTFEQFVNVWKEQKKERGYACPLGGGTIDFKQTTQKERHHSNRISADRIDNTKGYTVENLWFVTTKENYKKSGCTLRIMELTLEEVKRKINEKKI